MPNLIVLPVHATTNTHQSNEETNMNAHNTVVETNESLELNELRHQLGIHEDLLKEAEVAVRNFEYNPSDEDYDNWLDELYGTVNVGGYEYTTSHILAEVDPVAYRVGRTDFIGSVDIEDLDEYKDLEREVEELQTEIESIQEQIKELESAQ